MYFRLTTIFILFFICSCSDDAVNNTGTNDPGIGDIYYVKFDQQNFRVSTYTIKSDGSGKRLLNDSLGITSPSYSGKISLAKIDSVYFDNKLYVANSDGTSITEIPRNNYYPVYYILSPRGDKVLFTTDAGNYLCVVNSDGSGFIQISDGIRGTELVPKFSPDGNFIAYFEAPPSLTTALYVINSDGTNKRMLKDSVRYQYDASLDWSPDGTRIVFQNGDAPFVDICVIDTSGQNYIVLTEGFDPDWSPDGNKITFVVNVNQGIFDLFMINHDGTGLVNLSNSFTEYDNFPDWSPDSKKIMYNVHTSPPLGNIKLFDINSMTSSVLLDSVNVAFWKY